MANHSRGNHSRDREEMSEEKPLKKARYEWEVKGKSHLKDVSPSENVTNNNTVGNSILQRCFLADMASDEEEWGNRNIDDAILSEIPVTLVSPNPKNIDYYLRKWQARRMARGVVDNTINTILETWINPPIDFDASDLIENCENNGQVEDDGILMAIQSHGLQSSLSVLNRPQNSHSLENYKNYQHEISKEIPPTTSTNNCDNLQLEDPMDFLNAAVSAAIEKKGLSSCTF